MRMDKFFSPHIYYVEQIWWNGKYDYSPITAVHVIRSKPEGQKHTVSATVIYNLIVARDISRATKCQ